MSNFWQSRLGAAVPPQQAPAPVSAPAQPQAGPWWSNPLMTGQQPVQPVQQTTQSAQIGPEQPKTKKLLASRSAGTCPNCGGGDYGRQAGASTYERCFDCGYNARFEQQAAGAGMPTTSDGPATPALQVASGGLGGKSNYLPSRIVGKIE